MHFEVEVEVILAGGASPFKVNGVKGFHSVAQSFQGTVQHAPRAVRPVGCVEQGNFHGLIRPHSCSRLRLKSGYFFARIWSFRFSWAVISSRFWSWFWCAMYVKGLSQKSRFPASSMRVRMSLSSPPQPVNSSLNPRSNSKLCLLLAWQSPAHQCERCTVEANRVRESIFSTKRVPWASTVCWSKS